MPHTNQSNESIRVRVWDLPVRLFHWLVVGLFGFSWWTAESDHLDWHFISGYAILTLVLFRLFWGIWGSQTARFSDFVRGPRAVAAYFKGLLGHEGAAFLGHNPMGGWSVTILLSLLLLQTGLGLFATDVDGINGGPLDYLISFDAARVVSNIHGLIFDVLLAMVALHIAAILFYGIYKRENLVTAMITGNKRFSVTERLNTPRFAPYWRAILGLLIAALIVAGLTSGLF